MANANFDVIVIGAGFGGSSCAALLAKRGLKVLLLEKNARAGGKAMAITKNGFTYTAWVVITAPNIDNKFQVVLKELGMEDRVELVTPPGGSRFKSSSGKYNWQDPDDPTPNPEKLFNYLEVKQEEREDALKLMGEIVMMSPQDIDALDDISLAELFSRYNVPQGLYANLVGSVSDSCFVYPLDGVCASEGVRVFQDVFLRQGGLFCKGGIGKVAETFAEAVELNGGKAIMRAKVEKITVEQGRVTGVVTDKGSFSAPVVISNAGIQPTVLKLVGEEHFDRSYVNYVKELIPSWGIMGARYFTGKEVIKEAFGTVFSYDSCWSLEKCAKAMAGEIPEELTVLYEVPSVYDPDAAPPGKQVILTGVWCPSDPQMSAKDKKAWWAKNDEMMFKAFPDLEKNIESIDYYSVRDVSNLTRDQVLPNQGGECIGLAVALGQSGKHKPSVKAPIRGLFYVGCDAGGHGVGTQHAVDSGINVAHTVMQYHLMHKPIG